MDKAFLIIFLLGHILFAILILQAGQKLHSGRLASAGFLYLLLIVIGLIFFLESISSLF
tara:strand:- start:312 stop:488 length:177 start_codon:yes stop_codon:yes gene_type:complete